MFDKKVDLVRQAADGRSRDPISFFVCQDELLLLIDGWDWSEECKELVGIEP